MGLSMVFASFSESELSDEWRLKKCPLFGPTGRCCGGELLLQDELWSSSSPESDSESEHFF